MAGELHEVDIYGIVTTMTSDECRALAARLLKIAGDAPPQEPAAPESPLVAGTVRRFYPEKGHGFVRLDGSGAHDNTFFPLSAIEGAFDAADLYRGRPRVTRLILA